MNDYFGPLVYLPDAQLQPLSIFLSGLVVQDEQTMLGTMGIVNPYTQKVLSIQMKYVLIIIVILPIVCVYPFLQRHFAKGLLLGGIKE